MTAQTINNSLSELDSTTLSNLHITDHSALELRRIARILHASDSTLVVVTMYCPGSPSQETLNVQLTLKRQRGQRQVFVGTTDNDTQVQINARSGVVTVRKS